MKAVQLHGYGDVDQLRYEDVPTPKPRSGEVLVKVAVTSVNPIDWKIRRGDLKNVMPLQFPVILGRDVAGEVVETGANVSKWKPGQKVMGLVNRSYAEFLTASAEALAPIPDGLDMEQAGVLPLVTTTGAQLADHAQPKSGDTILITGALGSVGRTAVYEAKQKGARVIAGVRARQKRDARALRADQVVAIDSDEEIDGLPELDAIADTVDHDVIDKLLRKLKRGGVLGSVLGKPKGAERKDIQVAAFMAQSDAARLENLAEAVRTGALTIPIARKFKLSEAREAQKLSEQGGIDGKIALVV
ncbi:MAG TPA: NADP-dependent oxidoreductase [Bryobacteraceae bacterium]|jgi:NADPH:quinone reductase-like Zn-dependent oxidoreductase|nr:NADP-dependent oxidoreductase [Bryobacteraceae bacterium]